MNGILGQSKGFIKYPSHPLHAETVPREMGYESAHLGTRNKINKDPLFGKGDSSNRWSTMEMVHHERTQKARGSRRLGASKRGCTPGLP